MPVAAIRRAGTWVLARVASAIAAAVAIRRTVGAVLARIADVIAAGAILGTGGHVLTCLAGFVAAARYDGD